MHSVILAIELPRNEDLWRMFLAAAADAAASPATTQLSDHVWLIDVQKSPSAFAQALASVDRLGIRYRVFAIDAEPRELPTGHGPDASPARS